VSEVAANAREQEELYVVLKPMEKELAAPLGGFLRRIEQSLFQRLTIEEIESLAARFRENR
jgi:hypothetical protein